jgi:hypothetical protein
MRPSGPALFSTFSISVIFTALVALNVLGVVWLVAGPAIGAATEIVISHNPNPGSGGSAVEDERSPLVPAGPGPHEASGPAGDPVSS